MPSGEKPLPEISLLYVDDEPALLDIGKIFLEKTGSFYVTTAQCANEAIKLLSEKSFDAIVSDFQMPEMDGIEFLKHLRKNGSTIPFLIFTGKGREEIVIEALNEGVDFYVQKGGDPKSQFAELTHKIKKAIQSKRAEEAIEKRLITLTQPDIGANITFEDLFSIDEIQSLQDDFSLATGVASLITKPDGTPITKPSNFTRLCNDIIRKTETGCKNCYKSDAIIGRPNPDGPVVQVCLSGGLWDAGASIIINGHHIANWLAGQVRNEAQNEDKMREYAKIIGADEKTFLDAYREVPAMSPERFENVAKALFSLANQLSKSAYQNIQQAHSITEREKTEKALLQNTENLHAAYEELTSSEEELQQNLDEMVHQEQELRKSKKELSDIIEFLPDATFVIDKEGKVIAWNHATEVMTGVDKKDILGRGNYETGVVFFKERRPILIDLAINFDENAAKIYPGLERKEDKLIAELFRQDYNKGKGAYFWFTALPLYDSDGNIAGAIESIRDITERKRAENILKKSENLYRTIFDTTGAATIIINNDTSIAMANSVFANLSGFSQDELEGKKSWTEFIHHDDLEMMKKYHTDRRDPLIKVLNEYEFRFINRYGEIRHCINYVGLIPETSQSVASILDITKRKQAEETLAESEQRYRSVVEDQTEFICRFLPDGTHVFVNDAYCRYFGLSRDELVGKKFLSTIPVSDQKRLNNFFKSLTPKHPADSIEHRIIMPNGAIRWQLWNERAIFDNEGSVIEYQAVGRDITDRKKAEETLAESEERYRLLVENLHDIVYTITTDGIFTFVSPAATTLLGYPVSYSKGRLIFDFIHPDDAEKCYSFINLVKETGKRQEGIEYRIKDSEGSWHWHTSGVVPLKDSSGQITGFEGIARDITERKLAEDTLRLANRKLHILSGITRHDILNLVMVIRGSLEITRDYVTDSKQADYLNKIEKAIFDIQRHIEFTREYENLGVYKPVWLDIYKLIEKTKNDDIILCNNCRNFKVKADPMLEKVFANLMDNTIRHGERATEVHTDCIISDRDLKIEWKDNGTGVPDSQKDKIFEKGVGRNTGFGLFLAREILSITGIQILETGEEGKGARFEMIVPNGAWKIFQQSE
ncbi:MAG: PAS domain S-box protein [Methanomicrobium sp.]|nr:PAS domain S-box protein [Methanomicrobium sp.]